MKQKVVSITKYVLSFFVLMLISSSSSQAATYYVKPDGNDNADGKSDATAWKSISKVNSFNFQSGDDVYFKCGGKWNGSQLRVDWSGNSANRTVIGAYYMSGASEKIGADGTKPIIDGSDSTPSGEYEGLVEVLGNYIQVENLHIRNSEGHAVHADSRNNLYFYDIDTYNTYRSGARLNIINNLEVKRMNISHACMAWWENHLRGISVDHGGVLEVGRGSSNFIVSHNVVHDSYGEGIIVDRYNHTGTVEYNTLYENRQAGIYIDSSENIKVRYNLVYGSIGNDICIKYSSGRCGPGIWLNWENWESSEDGHMDNVSVYGNMIAGTVYGIYVSTQHPDIDIRYAKIYNNTAVNCGQNIYVNDGPFVGCEIKNNISYCANSDCNPGKWASPSSGMALDYNLWSSAPDSSLIGSHDPPYASPGLFKTSGWDNLSGGSLSPDDFKIQSSSSAINKGTGLDSSYNTDYWGNIRPQGTAWDIGAAEYTSSYYPICGNGITESEEECDEGENNGTCPSACSSNCSLNSCQEGEIVIDNGNSGTFFAGFWESSAALGFYGTDSLYSANPPSDYAWQTSSSLNGLYDVYQWHTYYSGYKERCASVPYYVYNEGNLIDNSYQVNQSDSSLGGKWNKIGTYNFSGTAKVTIPFVQDSCNTSADAIRFIKNDSLDVISPEAPEGLSAR